MGDDIADAAHVGPIAVLPVVKGGLQDRGRKDDLIVDRVIIGVDRLGGDIPFLPVHLRA